MENREDTGFGSSSGQAGRLPEGERKLSRKQIWLVNQQVDVRKVLKKLGVEVSRSTSCHCPFHPHDSRRSAKYHEDDNSLWCFKESKCYRAYDMLKFMDFTDEQIEQQIDFTNIPAPKKRARQTYFKDEEGVIQAKVKFMKGEMGIKEYAGVVIGQMRGKGD